MSAFAALASLPPRARPARGAYRRGVCISSAPMPPRRPNRVRVPREHSSHSRDWQWQGARNFPWYVIFPLDQRALLAALESLVDSRIVARVTALGARVLRRLSDAIERTLYPDVEKELVVDYGLTEPSPEDKTYVHPLNEWQVGNVNYYFDSFGRRVYLRLEGASAILSVTEFRDVYDTGVGDIEELEHSGEQLPPTGGDVEDDCIRWKMDGEHT